MRGRIVLLAGSIGLVAAALVVQACGDAEPAKVASAVDSGADVVDSGDPLKEAAAPEADAATCDPSADFTTQIPDASILDGATTTGMCLQCAHAKCGKPLDKCNEDCTCQGIAGEALQCYLASAGNPIACAGSFIDVDPATQQLGIALLSCINSECKADCATAEFEDAGADADVDAGN